MKFKTIVVIVTIQIFLFSPVHILFAKVRLPKIFGSNMVLQKGQANPVWGWAEKGEKVVISIAGNSVVTKAGKDGKWKAELPPMDYGGPYTLTVKGENTIELTNILIGEVWFCSGQSNMAMQLISCNDGEQEAAKANDPEIRLFTVPRRVSQFPQDDLESDGWMECSPTSVRHFSAAAYYFGRNIHQILNVPVGLIHSSWGGTEIESWMSGEMLQEDPDFKDKVSDLRAADIDNRAKSNPTTLGKSEYPTLLYNGMVNPIIPFGIKGVIWYQGESNVSRAKQYQRLFPNLITDWRDHWEQGEFPFLYVSIASYQVPAENPGESDWAELREAQTMTLRVPNTGMAVTIDIGEANNVHPKNKKDVGYRLALNALKIAYGKDVVCSGPMFSHMEITGNYADISFISAGSSLMVKDRYGYIRGFAIAGSDKKFHWAKAELINDHTVRVYSHEVEHPLAVRYAWADHPGEVNLYNSEGLPANPFRTDSWDRNAE
jgi:sialate O-acetylesterase